MVRSGIGGHAARAAFLPAWARTRLAARPRSPAVNWHSHMPITLKPVDVAVIGLGAAGGVAVLPLARAGLKVAGIEAGGWMDPRSFRPDEIHNNVRGLLTSVQKANREIPTIRENASSGSRPGAAIHPMMNAVG